MATATQPIVIGAGIIGASIAYHLAKAGHPPVIIDAGPDGGLATSGSFAWLNASWGNPEPYYRLRMRSIAEWHRLGRDLPQLPLRWTGCLTYDMSHADLDRYVAQHSDWGYRIRLVGREEIAAREPNLRELPEVAALCEDEGMVEPVAASRAFRDAAVALGAIYHSDARVESLKLERGRIVSVATSCGTIASDSAVLAGGIATPALLAPLGITIPMTTPEGLLVNSKPLPPVLNGLVAAPDFHVRQTAEGGLIAGFDFTGAFVEAPEKATARLLRRMNEALRLPHAAELSHTTLAQRPTPADGFPAVGLLPQVEGLYVAVMHSGMTLAPAVGLFAAQEILTGARDPLLGPYAPSRLLA